MTLVDEMTKTYDANARYSVERVRYYVDELFKLCPLKPGDSVRFVKMPASAKDPESGWYSHQHSLKPGCAARVVAVDHRRGRFVADVEVIETHYWSTFEKDLVEMEKPVEAIFPGIAIECLERIEEG